MTKTNNRTHPLILLVLIAFSLACLIPLWLIFMVSLTSETDISANGYRFWADFDFSAYGYLKNDAETISRAFGVSIFVTAAGTLISLLVTSAMAYSLSRRDFPLRGFLSFYVFFTMLFGGGLVPFYILMTQYLHLRDSILAIIIPGLLSPFHIMVMKGFLQKIPFEMVESAKMDGASEMRIFFTMVLPLTTPALATIGLMISFNYWNEWFNAMLFIDKPNLATLQLLLIRMLNTIEYLTANTDFVKQLNIDVSQLPKYSVRMAMAIMAAGPMLCVFPFFQRYFVAGLTLGSLKG